MITTPNSKRPMETDKVGPPKKPVINGVTVDGRDPAITIWDVEKLWDKIDKLTDFSYQQYKYNSILRVK